MKCRTPQWPVYFAHVRQYNQITDSMIYKIIDSLIYKMIDPLIYNVIDSLIYKMIDSLIYNVIDSLIYKMIDSLFYNNYERHGLGDFAPSNYPGLGLHPLGTLEPRKIMK